MSRRSAEFHGLNCSKDFGQQNVLQVSFIQDYKALTVYDLKQCNEIQFHSKFLNVKIGK